MLALSGRSTNRVARSGFGRKADMPNQRMKCPLMTQADIIVLRAAGARSPSAFRNAYDSTTISASR